jgi:uncharacterized repeat protein (TIGR01451 family)
VQPADYKVAAYIQVFGGWWTKPTFDSPTVAINPDGTSRININTGGLDIDATNIAAFLIPEDCSPPSASGGGLPTVGCAVANIQVARTQSSISGTITDSQNVPIAGAMISDPVLGSVMSAPDGQYCFYNVTTTGTATLTVSYPNYFFATSPDSVTISSQNQIVNFIGVQTVDLSVTSLVDTPSIEKGSNITETIIVSNAGPASATDASVSASLPTSFRLVSASSSRGHCTTATVPVNCDVGTLPRTASAVISIIATPSLGGSFDLLAMVSGPDPDSNSANNSTDQKVTVTPAPQLTSIEPAHSSTNGGISVTIHGASFQNGATVAIDGTPVTAVVSSVDAILISGLPPHAAGAVSVVVTNPDGSFGTAVFHYFTDDPLLAASTTIRAVQVTDLRVAINVQRARYKLPQFGWSTDLTVIRAQDIVDLRNAIRAAYSAAGRPAPTFTDSDSRLPGSVVKVKHIAEIRDALVVLENLP